MKLYAGKTTAPAGHPIRSRHATKPNYTETVKQKYTDTRRKSTRIIPRTVRNPLIKIEKK